MTRTLLKLFVASFYAANTGFFLFFFFIFFGTVNGGTLISYHASLLTSILGSWEIMGGVFFFWGLYELKCLLFVLRVINSEEGYFVYNLQALPLLPQLAAYIALQLLLYAPILAYSIIAICFGLQKGHLSSAVVIAAFQLLLVTTGTYVIYKRMNNWLKPTSAFPIKISLPKPFLSFLFHHFITERKLILAGLKIFSVLLLYIILVWNAGKGDNDSFLLFYLVILLAHFIVPFLSVRFFETELSFSRNMPIKRTHYVFAYLITYSVLLLPEAVYLLLYGQPLLSHLQIFAYFLFAVASLFLLTAVQYSEAMNRDEYMKVGFGLFFVSIFALHVQAFILWIGIQTAIGILLFWNGFYKYEGASQNSDS